MEFLLFGLVPPSPFLLAQNSDQKNFLPKLKMYRKNQQHGLFTVSEITSQWSNIPKQTRGHFFGMSEL